MKQLLFATLFIFLVLPVISQDTIPEQAPQKEKKPKNDKIYYGGTIGLSFGNYSRVAIYPFVGLRVTKSFRTALQIGYEYISDTRGDTDYNASNYGASILAQYNIIPAIYVHIEPAFYNYDAYYIAGENRVWVPYVFAGAGLHQRLGKRSVVYVQVKFDLLQDDNSPYKDWAPFFDVGVAVGI